MAVLVILVLILAMTTSSDATWCICRSDVSDAALQKSLDYACGAGADCSPILQTGVCYQPNTVRNHCNYAVNSYYQRKGQAQGTCDFASTATTTTTDPSTSSTCIYPSSTSAAGTTPSSSPPSTSTATGNSTPSGVIGGTGTSLGPTGINTNVDGSAALPLVAEMGPLLLALWFSCLALLRV